MSEEDKDFIFSLMPDWVKEVEEGLHPMFYGTGTCNGDIEVHDRVMKILYNINPK